MKRKEIRGSENTRTLMAFKRMRLYSTLYPCHAADYLLWHYIVLPKLTFRHTGNNSSTT